MPGSESYTQERDRNNLMLIREISRELPECARRFLNATQDTKSVLTRLGYARDLKTFFGYLKSEKSSFANVEIADITNEQLSSIKLIDFEEYSDYLNLYYSDDETVRTNAEHAKQRKLCALRSFFNYCFKIGAINSDYSRLIELPKIHDKPIIRLEIDEVAKLLDTVENGNAFDKRQNKYNDHTRERDLAILTLLLGTGIRVSELVGIDFNHIDFSNNSFLVTRKGGAQTILYFSEEVKGVLLKYIENRKKIEALPGHEQALFLSLQRKRIGVRSVEALIKKYARVVVPLKPRISPHKMRSTFGTNLYNETGDIYLVADVLGHADVNTTKKHYAAMSDERRRIAARTVVLRDDDNNDE